MAMPLTMLRARPDHEVAQSKIKPLPQILRRLLQSMVPSGMKVMKKNVLRSHVVVI